MSRPCSGSSATARAGQPDPLAFGPYYRDPDHGQPPADTRGLVLLVMVTPADVTDRDAAKEALFRLHLMHPEIAIVWADSAYAGGLVDWAKERLDIKVKTVRRPPKPRASWSCSAAGWSRGRFRGSCGPVGTAGTTRGFRRSASRSSRGGPSRG